MNGGICVECGKPYGEFHRTGCSRWAGCVLVDEDDCILQPEPPVQTMSQTEGQAKVHPFPGLTKVGTEWFNLPAIERQLKYEHQQTAGGSEKTWINLLRRLVLNIQREKGA